MKDYSTLFSGVYGTPHDTLPFGAITTEDVKPAILEGIRLENEEIEAIANNPEPPTFENTIVPFEKAGRVLDNATTYMYNMLSAETSDALEAVANELTPVLSSHSADIVQNRKLFERIAKVKETFRGEDEEDHMLLERVYSNFERAGATLDEKGKEAFRRITEELSRLTLNFSQNNLKETNAFVLHLTKEEELKGLPELQIQQAAEAAQEKGLDGWAVTLHAPSYVPFMKFAESRELRKRLYMAYNTKCTHDNDCNNFAIVKRIVDLRRELAQLLGYKTYAEYTLKRRMAESVDNVEHFLEELITAYKPEAIKEVDRVKAFAREEQGDDFQLMPWDFAFYSHRLSKRLYNFDEEMLRPYFELSAVKKGIFGLATTLYGITFKENKDIQTYHPDVTAYDVFDADGSFLAVLYADFFPRSTKQGGAWMTNFKEEWDGTSRPHVAIVMNLTKPTADKPSLLTLSEVETFLHEFGHALHGMFGTTRYAALSGTNVYWDFVELPSQFMENYSVQPDFLRTFARHYLTGDAIPEEYISCIVEMRNFNIAYACLRQVSFGLLDMAYYTQQGEQPADVRTFEKEAWREAQLLPAVDDACMSVQFGHIMSGGYSAGYYSYKWAELLDADAFQYFKENGIFSRNVAARFRTQLLSKGGTRHPMELYLAFRGRKPSIAALLARDGIKQS